MAGKDRSAPPLWLAPVLSVGLAAAAFVLAWLHGWPWGAFLLAEVLALMALTAALWRTGEGYPWWAYPALFVALVIFVFSWLYLSGRLDLAGAVQAGSAVVLAFFTITLWRSTQAQAEATKAIKELEERISRLDLEPFFVMEVSLFVVEPPGRGARISLKKVVNMGRLPFALRAVKWCFGGHTSVWREKVVAVPPADERELEGVFLLLENVETSLFDRKRWSSEEFDAGVLMFRVDIPTVGIKDFFYAVRVPFELIDSNLGVETNVIDGSPVLEVKNVELIPLRWPGLC